MFFITHPHVSIYNYSPCGFFCLLSGVLSVEVHEDMREAANNLVKHFHKLEQEVCDCNTVCVLSMALLHSFNLLAHTVVFNTGSAEIKTETFM